MVVKIEEKVVITNSSEAKNLNENEYFTAYFNDVKYGMTDYYEDLDGNGAAEVVQRAEILQKEGFLLCLEQEEISQPNSNQN